MTRSLTAWSACLMDLTGKNSTERDGGMPDSAWVVSLEFTPAVA